MTAIVLGAFLRGPLIILVHMYLGLYPDASVPDGMARGRLAGFRHRWKQRRGVLPDHVVRVGREEPRPGRVEWIGSDPERQPSLTETESIARVGGAGERRRL